MTHHFLRDGQERAYEGLLSQLLEKYADQLEQASLWQRWKLRRRIEREARAELEKIAPNDALYLCR